MKQQEYITQGKCVGYRISNGEIIFQFEISDKLKGGKENELQ
jgi:hypothetical protein